MDRKNRIDLSKPPPIPTGTPPVKQEIRKKNRGLGLALALLAVSVLACGYRMVHVWTDGSCTQAATCRICGMERNEATGHTWSDTACDTPRICSVCGESEAAPMGHSYAEGICTVCGSEEPKQLLKWAPGPLRETQMTFHPEDRIMELREPSLENFSRMEITIRDYQDAPLSKDLYTLERTEDSVLLHLPRTLAPGRYVVLAGVQETPVLEFWFGPSDTWMPSEPDKWFADFEVMSWKYGLYLAASDSDAPLAGVSAMEEATRFDSPWSMSGVNYTQDGAAVLARGNAAKFMADLHLRMDASGTEDTACTFRCGRWYLAMDSSGAVFLTDTLTDQCYWSITSSL